jgi:hypothetical protein
VLALVLPGIALFIFTSAAVCGWLIFTERDEPAAGRQELRTPDSSAAQHARRRPPLARKPGERV